MPVGLVDIAIVALFEASGVDSADAPVGFGNNSDAFRQVNGRLADAAVNGYVVVVPGSSAKIHSQFSDAHVDLQAPQPQLPDIQPAFTRPEVDDQIERFIVVETEVPAVVGINVVYIGRLFHQEMATKSTGVVVDTGPHHRAIERELGVHELGRAAPNVEFN